MVSSQLSKICGTSSHAPAWSSLLMGEMEAHFVTVSFKTGAFIESFIMKIFFGSLCLYSRSGTLQNSVRCNMIDNRQVEIFSSSFYSVFQVQS